MRLAVCSLWTHEIADYAELTMKNKRAYCAKWDYPFIEQQGSLDPARHPAWSKLLLIQRALPFYDWVFWTDADSLFTRDDIPLSHFIDEAADLIWSEDENGPNTGHFFLRRCKAAFELLRVAHAREDLTNHLWVEQEALRQTVASGQVNIRVKAAPLSDFNSQEPTFEEGQLIIHFPGAPNKAQAIHQYATRLRLTV